MRIVASWIAIALVGCSKSDVQHLGKIGEIAATKIEQSLPLDKLPIPKIQPNMPIEGIDAVRQRILSDQPLANAKLQIEATSTGIRLSGEVADENLRAHAIDLAQSTRGIGTVENQITVPIPVPPPTPAIETKKP